MTEQVEVRYMNADTRGIVEENFEIYFPEFGNLSLEEVLQQQESVYLSLQANNRNRASASGSTEDNVNREQSGGQQQAVENEGESPQVSDPTSQLELDEALALSLQELENQFSGSSVDGDSETESGPAVNAEVNSAETSTEAAREDTVDPDNMTYEELQSLGDEIGAESRGLSDELLEYLPSFKYKTGFFKKEKHEDCVICCMTYRNREKLTMLPCHHQYHSDCVKKWLKINKACPVCNEEVFGS